MSVIVQPSRRPAPTFRRGIGFYFSGIVGLLFVVIGANWREPSPTSRANGPSHARAVLPAPHLPNAFTDKKISPPLDLDAAAVWMRSHPTLDFTEAMTELFATTEGPPRAMVEFAQRLMRADAATARDCGYALIFALNRRGEFSTSANFAIAGPPEVRRDWIIAAYHDWGRRQPELALLSAAQITDAVARQTALQSALSGWARSDPESLADTAFDFPEGAEKFAALTKALRAWVIKDPAKAGDWILAHHAVVSAAEAALRDD